MSSPSRSEARSPSRSETRSPPKSPVPRSPSPVAPAEPLEQQFDSFDQTAEKDEGTKKPEVEDVVSSIQTTGSPVAVLPRTYSLNPSAIGPEWGVGLVGCDPSNLHDRIPARFVFGVLGDLVEARKRWQATKEWRVRENVDAILDEPQPNYHLIKKYYPHGFYKKSNRGSYLYVERPGKANIGLLWKKGLTLDDLARHYVFITEFMWRIQDPSETGTLISVFDVGGSAMSELAGNTLKLFQKCSELIGAHYPERSQKMFVVNSPWWFSTAYSLVSPFIDPRTKQKISVVGSHPEKHLLADDLFAVSNIPDFLGGTCPDPLTESEVETAMRELVNKNNAKYNITADSEFCMPNALATLGLYNKAEIVSEDKKKSSKK